MSGSGRPQGVMTRRGLALLLAGLLLLGGSGSTLAETTGKPIVGPTSRSAAEWPPPPNEQRPSGDPKGGTEISW
jgi:hypothetical protein